MQIQLKKCYQNSFAILVETNHYAIHWLQKQNQK